MLTNPSFVLGQTANLPARRIVKGDTTPASGFGVALATANAVCIGITGTETKLQTGYIATTAGDPVDVKGDGDVAELIIGTGGITAWAPVESDSTGQGILATGAGQHNIIGYAMQPAAAGAYAKILIRPEQITL